MDSIRIKNLRSLVDTGDINLNGITVLVGENSSGKSTLLRSFPLIKQSLEEDTITPILWYGKYVDFGSFEKSVNNNNNSEIVFSFEFTSNEIESKDRMNPFRFYYRRGLFAKDCKFRYTMYLEKVKGIDVVKKFEFVMDSNTIELIIENSIVKSVKINNKDYSHFSNKLYISKRKDNFVPIILIKDEDEEDDIELEAYTKMGYYGLYRHNNAFYKQLVKELKSILQKSTSMQHINEIISNFIISDKEKILEKQNSKNNLKKWKNFLNNDENNDLEFENLINIFICMYITEISEIFSFILSDYFKNVHYIAPIRANAERYYRIQNLSIDQVDFQGRNIPMLLKSFKKGEEEKFKKWMNDNFGFAIEANPNGDHLSINVIKNGEKTNMADTGFGYSQVIPIIVQLWLMTQKNKKNMTLLIEQPELHLHPKLQASLIDVIGSCVKVAKNENINLRILIETHSETIINRIGYLIYKNKINKEFTNIYIFNKLNNFETKVEEAFFDKQGFLSNWPSGFFEPKEEEE